MTLTKIIVKQSKKCQRKLNLKLGESRKKNKLLNIIQVMQVAMMKKMIFMIAVV